MAFRVFQVSYRRQKTVPSRQDAFCATDADFRKVNIPKKCAGR